jgi:hypothetical protein
MAYAVGEVGAWDEALFQRFRAAPKGRRTAPGKPLDPKGAARRAFLDRLIVINSPLIKTLVWQVQGHPPAGNQRVRTAMRLVGAGEIEFDVAMNLGRFAAAKAFETYDPHWSFSGYLVKKIFYELQCEVARMNMIHVDRGKAPIGLTYLEDDEQLGRLDLEEEPDDEEPQLRELEELEEKSGEQLAPALGVPLVLVPVVDEREALAVFIEDHCAFASSLRVALESVHARYHGIAFRRGETDHRSELATSMRLHGVTPTTVRVPWCETPVRGLMGVRLQSHAERSPSVV